MEGFICMHPITKTVGKLNGNGFKRRMGYERQTRRLGITVTDD